MQQLISARRKKIIPFSLILAIGTLTFLVACGDAPSSKGPTSLNSHINLFVDGFFKTQNEVRTKQDQDAFNSKNNKSNVTACVLDKMQNSPDYVYPNVKEGYIGYLAPDRYKPRLTDADPIYSAIKKYGVDELNDETSFIYGQWNHLIFLAIDNCTKY
jgi:hypothetical protein